MNPEEPRLAGKNSVRMVHTSDLHLGDTDGHPYAMRALKAVVDAVSHLDADLLLLAGDNFDHGRVSEQVVSDLLVEVARLDVPVVLLPGNHDLHGEGSVYMRDSFSAMPGNLTVIEHQDGETINFPELTLDVWGRAMLAHTPDFRPLEGMPARNADRWLVALAHGHYCEDDNWGERSSPIFSADIAGATCDYLALGHWDRHADVSHRGVTAVYSGTARGMTPPHYLGEVTVIDLSPLAGVAYRQVPLPTT